MHVLVTGGGGYLGSWVVEDLAAQGHHVRILDRFCFGDAALPGPRENVAVVRGDIRRLQETPGFLDQIDAIVHLASLSNDPSCDLDPEMALDVNLESTVELAKMAVQHQVRRFVFASSCTVYGRGVFEILDENSPANPVSTFGKSKLAAEQALLRMRNEHFEPVIARTGSMYGCSPRMRFDLALNQMVATALRQRRIEVRGGGNQWRPFVHVRDASRALLAMVEAPAAQVSGQVFNTGSDVYNTRIIDLARRVARNIGDVEVEIAKDDDDLRNFRVQFGKIRERLGFRCEWSIDDGIEEVKKYLQDNPIDPFHEKYFNVRRMKSLLATPVAEGGEPVAARFVPLAKPGIGDEEEQAVLQALRSGWLTSGPHVPAFERAFSSCVNAPNAVAVNSCTAALHLCLVEIGVKPGDEVVTSPITWASTGNTILNMGARPVFADVCPVTLNMDPASLARVITPRTRAIMPVHLAGQPCNMDEIRAVAAKHGIEVVEDAAHALGAGYKGRAIGADGPFSCFSFYAIKNITTMEGGMIAVSDPDRAARLRLLATNGMSASAWERYGRSAVPVPPEVVTPGYKYALGNVSAAMGLEQIKKFAQFMEARKRLALMYRAVLADLEEIEMLDVLPDRDHAWHLFVVQLHLDKLTMTRDEIAHELRRENIGTGVHFYGLHLHRYYREALGMKPEDCPEATRASHRILSLPLHPQLTDKNLHEVVTALKKVLFHASKRAIAMPGMPGGREPLVS